MKRIIGSLALTLLCALNLIAQNGNTTIKICGSITDSLSLEAVPYATVQILAQDSSSPYNQITDDKGNFCISLPQAASYKLTASFVGMKKIEKQIQANGSKDIELGKLLMASDDKELSEVTVAAARPLVKLDVDRIAYNMKEDPSAKSKNLLEMLRNVPLVTVDGQDNIQVKGSSKFKIYINGKPSTMVSSNPKEVLRSIPANTIKKVEIITDPGVKYDAEGVTAILNIVTDQGGIEGYSATIGARISTNGNLGGNTFLTTKVGKVGLTLNYSNWSTFLTKEAPYYSERISPKFKSIVEGNTASKSYGHFGNALISYELDSMRLFNLSAGIMLWNSNTTSKTLTQEWTNELLSKKMNQTNFSKYDGGSWDLGLDYQKSSRRQGELFTASYQFTHSPNNQLTRIEQDIEKLRLIPIRELIHLAQESEVKAGMDEHTGQLDYTTPLGKAHSIESGLKYIARRSLSDPKHMMLQPGSTEWVPGSIYNNLNNTDQFRHNQDVLSAYLAYNYRSTKYSMQAGLRAEYDWIKAIFPSNSEAGFTHRAFNWVPQLTLGYNVNPMTQLKLAYNFRISRPGIAQLNPFKLQVNDYTVNYGNPDLNAEKAHDLSLTLNNFSQKIVFNASLNYNFSNNEILQYGKLDPNTNIVNNTYGNIGKNNTWGLNLYLMYTPTAWLRLYTNAAGFYKQQKAKELDIDQSSFFGMIFAGSQATLPKDWSLNLQGGYYNWGRQLQNTTSGNYFLSMGVNKALLKKKLSIGVSVSEPFRKYMVWTNKFEGQGFMINTRSSQPARSISLSIRYSFGQMKAQVRKVQRSISNDDLKQSGGSGSGGATGGGATGSGGSTGGGR